MPDLKGFSIELQELIGAKQIHSRQELHQAKINLSKKFGFKSLPTNPDILLANPFPSREMQVLLSIKPVRTISGVAPIATMTAPIACRHGKCTFCPGGPNSVFGDTPQSYTGKEPSTMRGIRNNFDPYLIVFNRLTQYVSLHHCPEKIEQIVMGGTFPSFPVEYQESYIAFSLKAMNDFSELFFENGEVNHQKFVAFMEAPEQRRNKEFQKHINDKILKLKGHSVDLEFEKKRNEGAFIRQVAMCIETKPDWCMENEINEMLKLGCTRVELGVQSLNNQVLKETNRGHSVEDSIQSTQLMKDSFLKVGYHMMLGLPHSTFDSDVGMFRELFSNPDYKPDSLKIYPCLVIPGTSLYEQWKKGEFKEISLEQTAEELIALKKFIPRYTRIHRVQRDIPSTEISAGPIQTNLRQMVEEKMTKKKLKCSCIRCREAGINYLKNNLVPENIQLQTEKYSASGGEEVFLSLVDKKQDLLLGYLRLRIPSNQVFRKEIIPNSAGIRELHVVGSSIALGKEGDSFQHKGLGKQLVEEAERIAREQFDSKKLLVISGIGVREYYAKNFSFRPDGPYLSKTLK